MTTNEELNAQFDSLSTTALAVKAERDRLRASNMRMLGALTAALKAITRAGGPELGPKGRDRGLIDLICNAMAENH